MGRPKKIIISEADKKKERDTCETTIFAAEHEEGEIL